ncbi:ankyrin repeat domain-containing protein 46-like, partial [Notothenia coriiceps]|uniref:Ankyrin repeat domain-containing protein 46-like n=1 Tax=Notothenia coriiceps TaxID=8208 RepID=A0A6I9PGJ4_9TELE
GEDSLNTSNIRSSTVPLTLLTNSCLSALLLHSNHNGSTPLVLAKRRGVNKDAIRLLEGLEEQEVKGFNRGAHSKLETMQMADSESAMESHSLLNPNLQSSEGVLSSFRTTWQEFVEDLGFWRVLLLLVVIALLSLGIAYYVSGVLPFSSSQLELVH